MKDSWNIFDLITVVGSTIDAIASELGASVSTFRWIFYENKCLNIIFLINRKRRLVQVLLVNHKNQK
jgi:AraC-like DNA-binding protein